MAYNYQYINKLEQFGYVSYTLILQDIDGIMPLIRNDKYFSKEIFPKLDLNDLNSEAQSDIQIYTQQYEDEIALEQFLIDSENEQQEQNRGLFNDLQDAVQTKDNQKILDAVYSILKKNNDSLSEDLAPIIDTLEDAKVISPDIIPDDLKSAQLEDAQIEFKK